MSLNKESESSAFDNFSIEISSELGDQKLVNDLFAPESATSSPDDITEIKEEQPKLEKKKKVEEEPEKKNLIDNLLEEDDEEKEKETEEKEKEKEPKNEESEENSNIFGAFAKDLFKMGAFTADEGEEEIEITSAEEFVERFEYEKQKGANEALREFLGRFGEDYQNAFQSIFVKGVNPKEYFKSFDNLQNFAEMDLTQESSQLSIIRHGLIDQGFEGEDLEAEIERLKNYGDLEPVAKRFHKTLSKKEAVKIEQMEKQKAVEISQREYARQEYAKNVNSIIQEKIKTKDFDGIPINPKIAEELHDFLITDKYQTKTGEKLTEFDKVILDLKRPENHAKKVKLALLLKTMELDPTLSTIKRKALTEKSDEIFSEVIRQQKKTPAKKAAEKTTSWWS